MNQDRRKFLLTGAMAVVSAVELPFQWPVKKIRPSVVVMTFGCLNRNGHHYVKGSFELPAEVPLFDLELSRLMPAEVRTSGLAPAGVGRNLRVEGDSLVCDLVWHGPHAIPEHAVRTFGFGAVAKDGVVCDYELEGLMLTETPA